MGRLFRFLVITTGVLAFTSVTLARAALAAPPDPGAVERTIPTELGDKPSTNPLSVVGQLPRAQSQQARPFILAAVNIDGATVFSQAQLSRYFEPYLATEVDQQNLARIAEAITHHYRNKGYLLSYATVPSQNVEAGMVRLQVIEGRIDKVNVQGAGAAEGVVQTIAAPLVNGAPLKRSLLERVIGLIRDIPGLTVQDIVLSRTEIEGRYALNINMTHKRFRGFTYADSRATTNVGQGRVYSSFSISSLGILGDEVRGDLFAIPGIDARFLYGQALAAVPLGNNGLRFILSASRGDQYLRSDQRFHGESDNLSAQLTYPFWRSRTLTLVSKVSLTDWRSIGTQAGTRHLRDRLRVARFGIVFGNEGNETRFQGELSFSRGLGFNGMTQVGDPRSSRPDASGKFTKVVFTLDVAHRLGARVVLRAVAMAQYSSGPLLSAEEFSLGGNRIGRAYDFNFETGDRGAGAGAELSYSLGGAKELRPELFGFADGGRVKDFPSSASTGHTRLIASAGIGGRVAVAASTISLEAALPLTGYRHPPRIFASIFRSF